MEVAKLLKTSEKAAVEPTDPSPRQKFHLTILSSSAEEVHALSSTPPPSLFRGGGGV